VLSLDTRTADLLRDLLGFQTSIAADTDTQRSCQRRWCNGRPVIRTVP
jgi:hypothetical protein